jgi:aminopeptidase-like protein
VRETLAILGKHIPLEKVEIPTGTQVFDWEIPKEWNVRDACIKNEDGKRIVDFKKLNLHLLNYSTPVHTRVGLEELKQHLYSIPDRPDLVPYRTSYYQERWGFCISQDQLDSLEDEEYEVLVDSSLEDGSLTYGECYIRGETEEEILISTHVCHPSLCNDNLSGIAVATFLAKEIASAGSRYSYRFVFIPGTIGSIAWLSRNESILHRIRHGLVITLLGDDSGFTYKRSRQGNTPIDRMAKYFLENRAEEEATILDFIPYGYDERQYCSPGINLPVGCLTRKPFGEFPEYHTSGDNLHFIKPGRLVESLQMLRELLEMLEMNRIYVNLNPKCEPQLGRRGLYDRLGGTNDSKTLQLAILWVLNYSDGRHDLLEIAELSGIDFHLVCHAARLLEESELLRAVES